MGFIDLGILSIRKRNGFDNEALTQRSEKSADWIDRCADFQHGKNMVKGGGGLN